MRAAVKIYLASSNSGKLAEFRELAQSASLDDRWRGANLQIDLLPNFDALPAFEEKAPTFSENATGKALHYSRLHPSVILADDSGLVVPALAGDPGAHSARYAGPNASSAERNAKLLDALRGKSGPERRAYFVCSLALAECGRVQAVLTGRADGEILQTPRGTHGFGYDPVFYFPALGKSFAELSRQEKNQHSHRGSAFRKLLSFLEQM